MGFWRRLREDIEVEMSLIELRIRFAVSRFLRNGGARWLAYVGGVVLALAALTYLAGCAVEPKPEEPSPLLTCYVTKRQGEMLVSFPVPCQVGGQES